MRKLLGLVFAICLLAAALCITAFADNPLDKEPPAGTVMRVCALKADTTKEFIADYDNFEKGWNETMTLAESNSNMQEKGYTRLIVDIYTDWNANRGDFTAAWRDGKGFYWDTIYFQPKSRVTLNLNGHTINRGLYACEGDGEVMYIDTGADIVINNGTITGGFSTNGAGGIHINDDAFVVLNNVNVIKNKVTEDDGAGIAIYDDATLIMNGGSISDNTGNCDRSSIKNFGGGIYIEDSTVYLNNVTIANNHFNDFGSGAAIYARNSTVYIDKCKILNNGLMIGKELGTLSVISCNNDTTMTITDTEFRGNGVHDAFLDTRCEEETMLIEMFRSSVHIEKGCKFTKNKACILIYANQDCILNLSDSTFTDNNSVVWVGAVDDTDTSTFRNCKFNNNTGSEEHPYAFCWASASPNPTVINCDFGDSVFNNTKFSKLLEGQLEQPAEGAPQPDDTTNKESTSPSPAGSIIGDGSVTMILSLVALALSAAALTATVVLNKKKQKDPESDN